MHLAPLGAVQVYAPFGGAFGGMEQEVATARMIGSMGTFSGQIGRAQAALDAAGSMEVAPRLARW